MWTTCFVYIVGHVLWTTPIVCIVENLLWVIIRICCGQHFMYILWVTHNIYDVLPTTHNESPTTYHPQHNSIILWATCCGRVGMYCGYYLVEENIILWMRTRTCCGLCVVGYVLWTMCCGLYVVGYILWITCVYIVNYILWMTHVYIVGNCTYILWVLVPIYCG